MLALILSLIGVPLAQDPAPTRQDPPPAATVPAPDQGAVATLQGCAMEGERWVCRYQMPEIRIVEQAPQTLSAAVIPAAGSPGMTSPDPGVLTDAQRDLVTRCADAGWLSLCMPGDRRRARELKLLADAYDARRNQVSALLAQGRCDAAVSMALEGGSLALAREARAFCGR